MHGYVIILLQLFIKDMQPAYEQSLDWAKSLRDESDALQDRSPPVDCSSLHVAAKGVFESIIKVRVNTIA